MESRLAMTKAWNDSSVGCSLLSFQEKLPQCPQTEQDMLTWLMESEECHSIESIAMRMLNVNFVSMHTTTKVCRKL
jgi:hypothetical protein